MSEYDTVDMKNLHYHAFNYRNAHSTQACNYFNTLEEFVSKMCIAAGAHWRDKWSEQCNDSQILSNTCDESLALIKELTKERDEMPVAQPEQPAEEQEFETSDEVGNLVYRGNSVSYIYQKMQAYSKGICDAWEAMADIGAGADGKTDLPTAIRRLAATSVKPASVQGEMDLDLARAMCRSVGISLVSRDFIERFADFVSDWKKGDFTLPKYAELDMQSCFGAWQKFDPELATTPQPEQIEGDAKDAERYRWLRSIGHEKLRYLTRCTEDSFEPTIDAAIASQKGAL